jgi:chromosome segregation ATPase
MRIVRQTEPLRSDELAGEIAALEREIAELRSAEGEHNSAAAALAAEIETRRAELEAQEGRLASARSALAAHEQRLAERRADLNKALAAEARRVFDEAMTVRDAAGRDVSAAAQMLLERLGALGHARELAHEAFANAVALCAAAREPLDSAAAEEIDAVPDVMREAWDKLVAAVRQHIDAQFEDELVDAAARSPLGHAIKDLPVHLQELARNRHHALQKRRANT